MLGSIERRVVQRFLDDAAFLFGSVSLLLAFQTLEGSVCVINSLDLCGVKTRNIAQFLYACCKLDPSVSDPACHLGMLQFQNSEVLEGMLC